MISVRHLATISVNLRASPPGGLEPPQSPTTFLLHDRFRRKLAVRAGNDHAIHKWWETVAFQSAR